ncbi:MAG: zf-HC2 domain-containing protein [Acidobacteria bacterium]|nr:zf-HC2 domain-containing protein [Acidobacteriota bacterium]
MPGENQSGMQCQQFESLLSDALDGALAAPEMERFEAHVATCQDCGPMFTAARAGMEWMHSLEEVEPPRNLVRNILIATTGAEVEQRATGVLPARPLGDRIQGWLRPVLASLMQPRFALTFAMVFFSVSVALSAIGVHITDLRYVDLRPTAIRKNVLRGYYENSARVVRYYENIRMFRQFEAQVRELKEAARPQQQDESQQPPKENKTNKKLQDDNTSGPTNHNYYQDGRDEVMALSQPPRPLDPTLNVNRRTA